MRCPGPLRSCCGASPFGDDEIRCRGSAPGRARSPHPGPCADGSPRTATRAGAVGSSTTLRATGPSKSWRDAATTTHRRPARSSRSVTTRCAAFRPRVRRARRPAASSSPTARSARHGRRIDRGHVAIRRARRPTGLRTIRYSSAPSRNVASRSVPLAPAGCGERKPARGQQTPTAASSCRSQRLSPDARSRWRSTVGVGVDPSTGRSRRPPVRRQRRERTVAGRHVGGIVDVVDADARRRVGRAASTSSSKPATASQWSIGPIDCIAVAVGGASGPGSLLVTIRRSAPVQFDDTSSSAAASAFFDERSGSRPSPAGFSFSWPRRREIADRHRETFGLLDREAVRGRVEVVDPDERVRARQPCASARRAASRRRHRPPCRSRPAVGATQSPFAFCSSARAIGCFGNAPSKLLQHRRRRRRDSAGDVVRARVRSTPHPPCTSWASCCSAPSRVTPDDLAQTFGDRFPRDGRVQRAMLPCQTSGAAVLTNCLQVVVDLVGIGPSGVAGRRGRAAGRDLRAHRTLPGRQGCSTRAAAGTRRTGSAGTSPPRLRLGIRTAPVYGVFTMHCVLPSVTPGGQVRRVVGIAQRGHDRLEAARCGGSTNVAERRDLDRRVDERARAARRRCASSSAVNGTPEIAKSTSFAMRSCAAEERAVLDVVEIDPRARGRELVLPRNELRVMLHAPSPCNDDELRERRSPSRRSSVSRPPW